MEYFSVSFLVVYCTVVTQSAIICRNWVKWDISVLFLTTAWESAIISMQKNFKNQTILSPLKNHPHRPLDGESCKSHTLK